MMRRSINSAALAILGVVGAGCSIDNMPVEPLKVSSAAPAEIAPAPAHVGAMLACLKSKKAIAGKRFAVAVHADGTGKQNSSAIGATGSFLPQGTTASYASEALLAAGGTALNYYELNTERAIRQFGGDKASAELAEKVAANPPDYVIATSFTALDFLGGPTLDVRVAGIGPQYAVRGVQLEVMSEVYRPGDRAIVAMSSVTRQVLYREAGVSVSKFIGPGTGVLATGGHQQTDQQRLQESTREAIHLAVFDSILKIPSVKKPARECGQLVREESGRVSNEKTKDL